MGPPDITITIPPAESWRLPLSVLPPDERRQVAETRFYRRVLADTAREHRDGWWRRPTSVVRATVCDA